LICSIGSVIGGCFGYIIGWQFMAGIGHKIVDFYGLSSQFETIKNLYATYDAWAVGIAGFTPLPYKLFTITAGAFNINFIVFVLASAVSRTARFFIVGGLIYRFGSNIQSVIEKYISLITIVFTVLLVGGFVIIKLLF
jgi:membrane protein YqaA with SNARE-associated domain